MQAVEPIPHEGGRLVVIAEHQPPYAPMPASIDDNGVVMTEWEPSAVDLERLLQGGRVRMWTWTFGRSFAPVSLETTEPDCGMREGQHG